MIRKDQKESSIHENRSKEHILVPRQAVKTVLLITTTESQQQTTFSDKWWKSTNLHTQKLSGYKQNLINYFPLKTLNLDWRDGLSGENIFPYNLNLISRSPHGKWRDSTSTSFSSDFHTLTNA